MALSPPLCAPDPLIRSVFEGSALARALECVHVVMIGEAERNQPTVGLLAPVLWVTQVDHDLACLPSDVLTTTSPRYFM
jgi:hypothetical protein